jgi:hypothetical protein
VLRALFDQIGVTEQRLLYLQTKNAAQNMSRISQNKQQKHLINSSKLIRNLKKYFVQLTNTKILLELAFDC